MPGLGLGRDPARTPMQWDGSANAGFTTGTAWLPLAPDWATMNVEVLQDQPTGILTLYRRLLQLRRKKPALVAGSYLPVATKSDVLTYARQHGDRACLGPEPE